MTVAPIIPTVSAAGPDGLTNPAIFFHAHQDDETLTLGPSIEAHVNAGRHVIAVLVTDGRNSSARQGLGLSGPDFSAARDRELAAAYRALGVHQAFAEGAVDGALTDAQAAAIVWKWTDRFPLASFKAQTYLDSHRDHAAIGRALLNRWRDTGGRIDARFYVKREDWGRVPQAWAEVGGARTRAAANEYRYVNASQGRYGIGYRSVPGSFDALQADTSTRVHSPS